MRIAMSDFHASRLAPCKSRPAVRIPPLAGGHRLVVRARPLAGAIRLSGWMRLGPVGVSRCLRRWLPVAGPVAAIPLHAHSSSYQRQEIASNNLPHSKNGT